MAQTERSQSAIEALLADNTGRNISPQDARDAFASHQGYGGIVLSVGGAPASILGVGTGYSLVDIFDVISAQSIDANLLGVQATLSSTYALQVGSAGIYRICFWASFSSSTPNKLVTFRPHINGSPGIVEVDRFVSSSDTGVASFEGIIPYAASDSIDMRVKVDTGTADLTFLAAALNIHRVG
jgi:hypothetical protein